MQIKVFEAKTAYDLEYHINRWLKERDERITVIGIDYSVSTTNYGNYKEFNNVHGALIQFNLK